MSFQLMRYTELTPAATPAEILSVADVLAKLPVLRDALPQARLELAAATGNAARVAAEWAGNLAQQRVISLTLYSKAISQQDYGLGAAMGIVLMALAFGVTWLSLRFSRGALGA